MTVYLIKPAMEFRNEYLSFYEEWKESNETMIPWVISKDPSNFEEMLQFLANNEEGIGIPEGWVRDSTYWLVNESERVIGVVNIRHELTEHLLTRGGHIGYGIRPSERKKGYATVLLKQSLEKAKEIGIERALVVCDERNVGSLKTIVNNGGVPDSDFIEKDGNVIKRFWIDVN
ncbi:GNAT family N-acetyltransferase [Anaerobacillus alkaliphilus]|uniref:GNAT family N-acetyltransferase n=1 Tax=Anaerobacillus alkaliphilus TaxID=1548597 RepID=A0A4Q0VXB0_9BACI|nr:GNAT family N-acetyltransferase [Anaerobacillus alkaliphilus]RXJ04304.1 GNAT family N-acetyltransferase [Anaerobacillus alkaliphilus]